MFTGDTQPCQSVVDLARGADVMICMCWDDQEVMGEVGESRGQCGTTGTGSERSGRSVSANPASAGFGVYGAIELHE